MAGHWIIASALVVASLVAQPVAAQSTIAVPATAGWKHAQTGLIFRSHLAGLSRVSIGDNTKNELDVIVQYGSAEHTAVSGYMFRPAMTSVPVWFDRSEAQILARDIFAHPQPQGPVRSFAPPHASIAAGLRRTYVPGNGPFKSTAVALLPLGDRLVAVRASSVELDPAALDATVDTVLGAIDWPTQAPAGTAATPVASCAAPLAYAAKAKLTKPDMHQTLFGALLAGAATAKNDKPDAAPVHWCREADGGPRWGAYRAENASDGYVMALGDAGRTISVFSSFSLEQKKNVGYRLTLGQLDQTLVYPDFDKLPKPEAALEAVMKTRPVSSASRDGKDINIGVRPS
jgi:hypothetical protein